MGHYEPRTVCELANIVDDVCQALQNDCGASLCVDLKQALAKRVLEFFDGISDPEELRVALTADSFGHRVFQA